MPLTFKFRRICVYYKLGVQITQITFTPFTQRTSMRARRDKTARQGVADDRETAH